MIPVIAVAGVVLDAVEGVVEGAELLPDALDEGTHIDPITLLAPAGDEAPAPHDVVDIAIGEISLRRFSQRLQDGELGQRQLDAMAVPEGAADGRAQLQLAALDDFRSGGGR